jgi:hypothetical protein
VFESSVVDGHDLIGGFNHLSVDRALDRVLKRGVGGEEKRGVVRKRGERRKERVKKGAVK